MDWKAKKETLEWLRQLLMFNVTVFTFSFEHFHAKCIQGFIKLTRIDVWETQHMCGPDLDIDSSR